VEIDRSNTLAHRAVCLFFRVTEECVGKLKHDDFIDEFAIEWGGKVPLPKATEKKKKDQKPKPKQEKAKTAKPTILKKNRDTDNWKP